MARTAGTSPFPEMQTAYNICKVKSQKIDSTGSKQMPIACAIVLNQRSRTSDKYGSGQFGVSRDHHSRSHQGLDVVASPGELIFSPIDGTVRP
jgi:hypothetical protein